MLKIQQLCEFPAQARADRWIGSSIISMSKSSPQAGMNRLIDVENPTAMRVPCASEGGPMDWVIDHLDVKEFPTSGDGPWIQQ